MTISKDVPEYKLEINGKSIILDHKKYEFLKCINQFGSIIKAAEKTSIPYRSALKYIELIEKNLGSPIVITKRGGKGGGGSSELTDMGKLVIKEYAKFNIILKKHSQFNELEGEVSDMDKKSRVMKISLNGIKVMLPLMEDLDIGNKVLLLLSPEDIFIMLKPQESSVRNIFEGKIVGMEIKKQMVRLNILVDGKINIFAYITEHSREELELNLDKNVFIGFKAASVPIIKL
ncbi:MAG: molybdenum-dependent transcriptional regulator [Methanomicrobiales archaeon]